MTKMWTLVLLLIFYPFINVTGINLTYIVRKDKGSFTPSCIAEELERYIGIGWVYPVPRRVEELPTVASKYIPNIDNGFNCKFTKNSHCTALWSLRDWTVDHSSPRTKQVITDSRWEDFPSVLISNDSKEFTHKVEVDYDFKTAFSIRADGIVEIFICNGENPYTNPCYYFYISYRDIYFKQYSALPKNMGEDFKIEPLENYKAYSNILSPSIWKTFVISKDPNGLVQLVDVNLNRTLIEHIVTEPLTPLYMFMRSANASLWKIHQNSFFFTSSAQISRFGPQLSLPNRDLCISFFVKVCRNCEMIFFYLNNTRKILKTIGPIKSGEWTEIKLKEENVYADKLNLFVETKFVDPTKSDSGFWAIDDVRVCNENEVKVQFLKLKDKLQMTDENITCQLIKNPNWTPKKIIINQSDAFPEVSTIVTNNSIELHWPQEDTTNSISYFVYYQSNDICTNEPYNLKRLKSNGFLVTKENAIVLENLIPFTMYNVTISSVLHETERTLFVNTMETVEPTLEELPSNFKLKALDTSINVSWDEIDCSNRYGRIAYTIIISNTTYNFTKEMPVQTDHSYEITDLQPYTHYTLTILTGRNGRNLYKKMHIKSFNFNFATMPGVAPRPENLEIYSMDSNSASLRYDLPANTHGITKEISVNKCNSLSFSKCKSSSSIVKRCSLWPKKYCVDANYLIPGQGYTFKVSLKNLNTHSFGKEALAKGVAAERVPGKPTNVTYRMVDCQTETDYCHLNVTWLHPYEQNGTITQFEIILNSTKERKDIQDMKYIHEIYNIENKTYYYDYTYQIKYLPYSSYYDLYIQSTNTVYKSEADHVEIHTDDLGQHIDQNPKLLAKSDSTLMFKIPHLDRRLEYYNMTVVVQDFDKSRKIDEEILRNKKVADNLCNTFGNTWISQVVNVDSNKTENILIGNAEKEKLQPGTKYCIAFIITNRYKDSEHDVVYYEKLKMLDTQSTTKEVTSGGSSNHLYMLLLILLLVPVGFLVYRYCRKKNLIQKPNQNNDHAYETLPCGELDRSNNDINDKSQAVYS